MSEPLVIIVSGPPASGKSTLAQEIARELKLPMLYKDGIKETLFDTLGWHDREWSKKLGMVTYHLLYYFLEAQLAAGQSLIVESNFGPAATAEFRRLKEKYPFQPFQVLCRAEGSVLVERYAARTGHRHPGHVDQVALEEIKPSLLKGYLDPLEIGGEVVEVETTDLSKIDTTGLLARLKELAAKG